MKPTDKVFATTIGAERWAQSYEGEFPIDLDVRRPMKIKGKLELVVVTYRVPRKPTDADLVPVGYFIK